MRSETHPRHHQVIIDHAQAAEAHPLRVMIIREAESVISIQPAVFGVAPLISFSYFHHGDTMHPNSRAVKDHVSCLSITKGYAPFRSLPGRGRPRLRGLVSDRIVSKPVTKRLECS